MQAHGVLQHRGLAGMLKPKAQVLNGPMQGNCQVARARVSRSSYETEDDIIFGSSGNEHRGVMGTSSRPLRNKVEGFDVRYPDGNVIQGVDFFADIEEWVDLGVHQIRTNRTEELSTVSKKTLAVMCNKIGLVSTGVRRTLVQRIIDYEISHPNSTEAVKKVNIGSIIKDI